MIELVSTNATRKEREFLRKVIRNCITCPFRLPYSCSLLYNALSIYLKALELTAELKGLAIFGGTEQINNEC
jgi:hypothetical protein